LTLWKINITIGEFCRSSAIETPSLQILTFSAGGEDMTSRLFLTIAFFFLLASVIGCASMSDVLKSKDEGTIQVYSVNADQSWEIATTVLR